MGGGTVAVVLSIVAVDIIALSIDGADRLRSACIRTCCVLLVAWIRYSVGWRVTMSLGGEQGQLIDAVKV